MNHSVGKANRRIPQGGLTSALRTLIKEAVNSAGHESASEWLVAEGYAATIEDAREIATSAFHH